MESTAVATRKESPVDRLKTAMEAPSVKSQFENALKEGSRLFTASLIELYTSDNNLQQCAPGSVIAEALKAATLGFPLNKQLGYAYIVAFKGKPTFVIGYKGLVQLAIRTGQYKHLNAGVIYEGQNWDANYLTGEITISGEPSSETAIGYFAYLELLNGFSKAVCWTKEHVINHAKAKSPSWKQTSSAWHTDFDEMAKKTMMRNLLTKYGLMSIEMMQAVSADGDERNNEVFIRDEIEQNANKGNVIDVDFAESASAPDDATPDMEEPPF